MTNEPEWRDANPETADLPNKGRMVILYIAGGLVIGALTIIGLKMRQVGLAVGTFAFFSGIGMLFRRRKTNYNYKAAVIVTVVGFLMMLAVSSPVVVKAVVGHLLITGAIGLVVLGIGKAIKLAWDLGKRS